MPCVYEYVCRVCGEIVEFDRPLADDTRHIAKDSDGVCGTLRRVWSVNVNRSNLRDH